LAAAAADQCVRAGLPMPRGRELTDGPDSIGTAHKAGGGLSDCRSGLPAKVGYPLLYWGRNFRRLRRTHQRHHTCLEGQRIVC